LVGNAQGFPYFRRSKASVGEKREKEGRKGGAKIYGRMDE